MRILIIHKNDFNRMAYDRAVDHSKHDVIYAGRWDYIDNIPKGLKCQKHVYDQGDSVIDQLRDIIKKEWPVNRIIAHNEKMILMAAELREEFGIPGMKKSEALKFRDKVKMKEVLASRGLRVPKFVRASDMDREARWGGKTIVKPKDGAGSEGVLLFDSYEDARKHIHASVPSGADTLIDELEVEEYLDGPIWHVDGFLFRGLPFIVQSSRRVGSGLGFIQGSPIASVQFDQPALDNWAVECVRALGGETLTFHLEAILTDQGPVFMEVAARCGGSHIVDATAARYGVNLHELQLAVEVDGALHHRFYSAPKSSLVYGFFVFPGHLFGGAACEVEVPEEFFSDPKMIRYRINRGSESTPLDVTYRPEKSPFSGLFRGEDPDELIRWVQNIFDNVRVRPAA